MAEVIEIDLLRVYDCLQDPRFVMLNGVREEENGLFIYTAKAVVSVPKIGEITLWSVCTERQQHTVLFLVLGKKQEKILRQYGVVIRVKRRKNALKNEEYLCFPDRNVIEKIASL